MRRVSIPCCSLILILLSYEWAPAQTASQSLDEYLRQARDSEARQDFGGAERLYRAAAAAFPKQPEVLKRLGLILQTELRFRESIDTFQQVLEQAPQYPEVNFYVGLSYLGMNELKKPSTGSTGNWPPIQNTGGHNSYCFIASVVRFRDW